MTTKRAGLKPAARQGGKRMQRYLLFAGETFNTLGGMGDFQSDYAELQPAVDKGNGLIDNGPMDWWHILDCEQAMIVSQRERSIRHGEVSDITQHKGIQQ